MKAPRGKVALAGLGALVGWLLAPVQTAKAQPTAAEAAVTTAIAAPTNRVAGWGSNWDPKTVMRGVTAISAGYDHTLALLSDSTVLESGLHQIGVPKGLRDVTAVAAGYHVSLALKNDGTVVEWGSDYGPPLYLPPADLQGVTAIASGSAAQFSLALRKDGTVVGWGADGGGPVDSGISRIPAGLHDVVAISVGGDFAVALRQDGTVVTWGGRSQWGLNGGVEIGVPPGLSGVKAISAGGSVAALRRDGTVINWEKGDDASGVALIGVPIGLRDVSAVSAAAGHVLALQTDGTVVAWGGNDVTGEGSVPPGLTGVTAIAAGSNHSAAITTMTTPLAPLQLSGKYLRGRVTVRWQRPAYEGLAGVTGYLLTAEPGNVRVSLPASATSYIVKRPAHKRRLLLSLLATTSLGNGPTVSAAATPQLPLADFDGDGRSDLAVFRPATGSWHIRGQAPVQFGRRGDIPAPGDYDGDGKTDIAVFRPATNTWYVQGHPRIRFGHRRDRPVPGDYDGDGTTEIAVYNSSTGFHRLGDARLDQPSACCDGVPASADYNGDGAIDYTFVEWDVSGPARWHVLDSRNTLAGRRCCTESQFADLGFDEQRPVPADYNGDGRVDVAIYYGVRGSWRVCRTTDDPDLCAGPRTSLQFGKSGDIPVPADYNGDGRAEIAVFRPSTGTWYVAGAPRVHFGQRGDIPLAQ